VKVANPSSQNRTPRCAILLAVSPAPASYRASGLVPWPLCELRLGSEIARLAGQTGSEWESNNDQVICCCLRTGLGVIGAGHAPGTPPTAGRDCHSSPRSMRTGYAPHCEWCLHQNSHPTCRRQVRSWSDLLTSRGCRRATRRQRRVLTRTLSLSTLAFTPTPVPAALPLFATGLGAFSARLARSTRLAARSIRSTVKDGRGSVGRSTRWLLSTGGATLRCPRLHRPRLLQ